MDKAKTKMDCRNLATIFATIVFGNPDVTDHQQYTKENEKHCVILEYFIQCGIDVQVRRLVSFLCA